MAISRKISTPQPAVGVDLSSGFGAGVPTPSGREYTRRVAVLLTPAQYAALEQAVTDRGYPRHGGPSRILREVLGKELGFEP